MGMFWRATSPTRGAERSSPSNEGSPGKSDALIAVSTAIRDQLLDLGIGRTSKWRVISVGLDLGELLTIDVDSAVARTGLGLLQLNPSSASWVGSRQSRTTTRSWKQLPGSRVSDATNFVVAGDGELRSRLEERGKGPR